ncbi:hypothetical protein GCM10010495_59190 [Kitasatospora herbaricolor]|uniref:hypothetical protein n=1 Tax=Kitasatospora herbaricolor TaxID=68217 RepID=UPI00174CC310|nr:hypothetical protein [Kitasatospora herbaricolor]MDQ0306503.1 hypothetical protein [Kitasatospora herbaricolor]GGV34422.1 hypothetical protein GCM10010495_59190 [Kitasatospora herbaricolor]
MRTPVISRFVATSAAALTLGVALPLLAAPTNAWACGEEPETAATAPAANATTPAAGGGTGPQQDVPARHKGALNVTVLKVPTAVTVGDEPQEISVDITNDTDGPYTTVRPLVALFNPNGGLQIPDLTMQWWNRGAWQPLSLRHSCDPVVWVRDEAMPTFGLGKGETAHMKYRFGVSAKLPTDVSVINVGLLAEAEDSTVSDSKDFDIKINHAKAPTSPTPTSPAPVSSTPAPAKSTPVPTAAPTTGAPAQPATVPAADNTTPAVVPTTGAPDTAAPSPTPAAAPQELARTGSSGTTGILLGSAVAMLVVGAGVFYAVKRAAER